MRSGLIRSLILLAQWGIFADPLGGGNKLDGQASGEPRVEILHPAQGQTVFAEWQVSSIPSLATCPAAVSSQNSLSILPPRCCERRLRRVYTAGQYIPVLCFMFAVSQYSRHDSVRRILATTRPDAHTYRAC